MKSSRSRDILGAAIGLLAIALVAVIRLRLRAMPLERDEGEFAYLGQSILHGIPPYAEAYNMKLPGIYAAYAALMAVFGQTATGIHIGLLLVNAAACVLIFFLARRLLDPLAGGIAAASYALLSVSPLVIGLAGHATQFVVPFAVGGLLLLLRGIDRPRSLTFFGSGLLLGVAVLMKQPAAAYLAFATVYLVTLECMKRPIAWRQTAQQTGLLIAGGITPFLLTCAIMAWLGVFNSFWFWTVTYASSYGGLLTFAQSGELLAQTLPAVVQPSAGIWLLAAFGLAVALWNRSLRRAGWFCLGLLVFSLLATSAGMRWMNHYFIFMLPAVAILCAMGTTELARLISTIRPTLASVTGVLIFTVAASYSIIAQRAVFFEMKPTEVCRAVYGGNPFPEAVQIGDYLREHSHPSDRIAVLGSEPEIPFYARRRSATGYIYMYPLMEAQPFAERMQRELIRQIEEARPEYLVVVNVSTSWLIFPDSHSTLLNWLPGYCEEHYQPVDVVEIGPDRTQYKWGESVAGFDPQAQNTVIIYRRKTGAPTK